MATIESATERAHTKPEQKTPQTAEEYDSQRGGAVEKDEWVLSLLGEEYGLGGLMYRFPHSKGIVGMGQNAERRFGKMIDFDVPNQSDLGAVRLPHPLANHFSNWFKQSGFMTSVAWSLRAGHIKGLVRIQKKIGPELVMQLIGREENPGLNLLLQIEACREGLPDGLVGEIDRAVWDPSFPDRGKLLFMRDQFSQSQLVRVPQSLEQRQMLFRSVSCSPVNHLYPKCLTPLTESTASTTYDRAWAWLRNPALA